MPDLTVITHSDGVLVVDSRLIAHELGIEHESFIKTIKQYQTQTEQAFGVLRFEIGKPSKGSLGGRPENFVLLTEDQATFLMTLSRNTLNVVQCKVNLVSQFSKAKKLLLSQGYYREPHTSVYIRRLENFRDHIIADHLWCVFQEGARILLTIERDFRIPVDQMDLCDGSIGTRWRNYRKGKEWAENVEKYVHVFRDQRRECNPNAYQLSELPYFRKWLREEYEPIYLPFYLTEKYGKRAVLQIYQEQNKINDYILELTEEKKKSKKQDEKYEIFLAARETLESRLLNE